MPAQVASECAFLKAGAAMFSGRLPFRFKLP
jgi:hypothetical protein